MTRGAFGIRLAGLGAGHPSLPEAPESWPLWTWSWSQSPPDGTGWEPMTYAEDLALWVRWSTCEAIVVAPVRPGVAGQMHPWLTTLAGWIAWQSRRVTLHGGGIIVDGAVWVVLGSAMAGKTSTLGWAASRGIPITSDDLVVIDGRTVLTGTGCLDLREATARHLGMGTLQEIVPGRERYRVWLEPVEPVLPLAGFVAPAWGPDIELVDLPIQRLLGTLVEHSYVKPVQRVDAAMLPLLGLPLVSWTRPKDLARFDEAGETLLAHLLSRS